LIPTPCSFFYQYWYDASVLMIDWFIPTYSMSSTAIFAYKSYQNYQVLFPVLRVLVLFPVLYGLFLPTSPTRTSQVLFPVLYGFFLPTSPTRTNSVLFPVLYGHFLPTIPTRIIKYFSLSCEYFSLSSTAIFSLQFLPELSSTFPCPQNHFGANNF